MSTDPYAVLGVARDADAKAVADAYRKLMRTHHPDVGGDAAKAAAISQAFSVLSDPGRRAEYDLDSRRAAEQSTARPTGTSTTGGQAPDGGGSVVFTVPPPPPGPVVFKGFRWTDWITSALAGLALIGAMVSTTGFAPVLTIAALSSAAAAYAVNKITPVHPSAAVVPALVVGISTNPVARWLDVGTVPLMIMSTVMLLVAVAATLWARASLARQVGYTTDARWMFYGGRPPHPFLASLGNVSGWVGVTGNGSRFDTLLMNGRTVIVLCTARPTHPGEELHWARGQLLRTRAGSAISVPDTAVDLLGVQQVTPKNLDVSWAVFVPGLASGAGPTGSEVSVVGEQDLLDWMSQVRGCRIDRRDILEAVELVQPARTSSFV